VTGFTLDPPPTKDATTGTRSIADLGPDALVPNPSPRQ
jgi:hypothetical protein